MRSQLQIEASRRNSQKSTGPRTASGKAASSLNSIKTGIYAAAEVITGEDPADLEALAADYHNRFLPDAPEQRCLVDILIHCELTLRRLRRVEAQLWDRNTEASAPGYGDENLLPLGRAANYMAGQTLARLQYRMHATQRNYERALKELGRLQPERPAEFPAAPVQPVSLPAPLGFVPSTTPPQVARSPFRPLPSARPAAPSPACAPTSPPLPAACRL